MKFAPSKIYVRFFYLEGSEMHSYWGSGPFYAMCNSRQEAEEHVLDFLDGKDYIHQIQVKTGREFSKAEA